MFEYSSTLFLITNYTVNNILIKFVMVQNNLFIYLFFSSTGSRPFLHFYKLFTSVEVLLYKYKLLNFRLDIYSFKVISVKNFHWQIWDDLDSFDLDFHKQKKKDELKI